MLSSFSKESADDLPNLFCYADHTMTYRGFLGEGGFAKVYLYEYKRNGNEQPRRVAVKILTDRSHGNGYDLRHEISCLEKCQHRNIVRYYDTYKTLEHGLGLVLEYCENGTYRNFFNKVKENNPKLIKDQIWPLKVRTILEVILAMEYLHEKGIIHADLKTDNVLLDEELTVKVVDFGLSRSKTLVPLHSNTSTFQEVAGGTKYYMAPEGRYSYKFDVYSFGILLWEIVTNELPYGNEDLPATEIQHRIKTENLRPDENLIPASCPWYLPGIMTMAWDHDKEKRPTFKDIRTKILEENPGNILDQAKECENKVMDVLLSELEEGLRRQKERDSSEIAALEGAAQDHCTRATRLSNELNDLSNSISELGNKNYFNGNGSEKTPLLSQSNVRATSCSRLRKKLFCRIGIAVSCLISLCLIVILLWYFETPRNHKQTNECETLPNVEYTSTNCTHKHITKGTYCQYKCKSGRIGNSTSYYCSSDGTWIGNPSSCECPTCRCGDDCSFTNSWLEIKNKVTKGKAIVNFAGHQIQCKSEGYRHSFEWRFKCTCTDEATGNNAQCRNWNSDSGSCQHTLVELIREMVAKSKYPTPCDNDTIDTFICIGI